MKKIIVVAFASVLVFSTASRSMAQQAAFQISSRIQETFTPGNGCPKDWPPTYISGTQQFTLVWDLPAYPISDNTSPIGYWKTPLFARHVSGWFLPGASYQGSLIIRTNIGCFHYTFYEQQRQFINDERWHMTMDFVFPDGSKSTISSAVAQVEVIPVQLVEKVKMASLDKSTHTKDPVNIATGEMHIAAADIQISSRGADLALARTYRSQSDFSGMFGYGWHSDFDINLSEDAGGNVIISDGQGVGRFFTLQTDGSFRPSAGNFDTLLKGPDGRYFVTAPDGAVSIYSAAGRLESITDRYNNTLSFVYDPVTPGGTYIEDATGRRITLTLDAQGRVTGVEDPSGAMFYYGYDADGNLTNITDPMGSTAGYLYDASHNIVQMTNANGHNTYFAYDPEDRAYMNWQDNDVNKVTLDFISPAETVATDSLGNQTHYVFNEYGLEVSRTDALGNTATTEWDPLLNMVSHTDENGNTTRYSYDQFGNLTSMRNALTKVSRFIYGSFNSLSHSKDFAGQWTYRYHDSSGNLIHAIDPLGNETFADYDSSGNLMSSTDARAHTTGYEYDTHGNLKTVTDPLLNITRFIYDTNGNKTSETNARLQTTSYEYDGLNRLIKVTYPDLNTEGLTYDGFGNRLTARDRNGRLTRYEYDDYERLRLTADPSGGIIEANYNSEGFLISVTDPNSNTTSFAHDALGRVISELTPEGKATLYGYDPAGNVKNKTNANGHLTVYTYDVVNRLQRVDYFDGTSVQYGYDDLSRRISMSDSLGVETAVYDALGRVKEVHGPRFGDNVAYTYDENGNRLSMTDQDGRLFSYTYDELNRLKTLSDANGTTTYNYDALGNVEEVLYPNGTKIVTIYDLMNRPATVTNLAPDSSVVSSFAYEYDDAGQVIKKILAGGSVIDYSYDPADRLLTEVKTSGSSATAGAPEEGSARGGGKGGGSLSSSGNYDLAYIYDMNGNRASWTRTMTLADFYADESTAMPQQTLNDLNAAGYGNGRKSDLGRVITLVKTYEYDNDNRLLSWTHRINAGGTLVDIETFSYAYDENGSRTVQTQARSGETPRVTFYAYDAGNRLTDLQYVDNPQAGIASASFEYNGDGLRTKAVEGSQEVHYYYDGDNVILEKDGAGATSRSYTRAVGYAGGIAGLIAQRAVVEETTGKGKNKTTVYTEKNLYYHYDALGSVANLTDDAGSTQASYEYDAFGNTVSSSDSVGNTYRFSSKEWESHAGLIYFGARYYDPLIGRWLTPDPAGFVDGLNVYLYVNNNPLNLVDPYGLSGERKDYWDYYWQEVYDDLSERWKKANEPLTPEERREYMENLVISASTGGANNIAKALSKNDKIIRVAVKSVSKEQKLLKPVTNLVSKTVKPAPEPWWSKLFRLFKKEELPKQNMNVPYVP